jgi:hypothetical protein
MKKPSLPKMTRFGKRIVLILTALLLIWPLTYGVYWMIYTGYTALDQTRFPQSDPRVLSVLQEISADAEETQKGAALSTALRSRLQEELDSTFGWSVNDLWFSPTRWLDNRANRQRGTIFATRMLLNFFSTNLAKYGAVDAENNELKQAREKRFAFTEDSWWFPSSESEYRKGIELLQKYENDLIEGQAVYNMRSDDMYNLLHYITGEQFLDQPLGLLVQSNDEVPYNELDDRIYYTQGVVLVTRNFLKAFFYLYPEVKAKGGEDNLRIAMRDIDRICTFDPLVVLRGEHDSIMADHRGKMARYLISVRERVNDVAQSIRR